VEKEVGRIADGDRAGGPADLSRSSASQPEALIPCAADALRETLLNLEGIEEDLGAVKRRVREWIERLEA
jgi:hypothetical protein